MPFNWNRRRQAVAAKSSQSAADDHLSNDASLKAAQAIFRKNETSKSSASKVATRPTPQPRRRITISSQKPQVRPKQPVSVQRVKPAAQNPQSAAAAAAAKAQKSNLTVEPRIKPSKSSKFGHLWNPSSSKDSKQHIPVSPPSTTDSPVLDANQRNSKGQDDDFVEIIAKLQATRENNPSSKPSRPDKSGSSSPRNYLSTGSTTSLNTSCEDVARLHHQTHSNGPPLLSQQDPHLGSRASGFNSSDNLSPNTPCENLAFLNPRANSSRTITIRRPTSRNQTREDVSDSVSISSAPSSAYSGVPTVAAELPSDQNLSEFSVSPRAGPYRHELARSSIDQTSSTADLYSERTSVDGWGKGPQNVKYHGTLPDLIPNHTRDKKKGRLSSIFGRKPKGSDVSASNPNDSFANKNSQPTRLKTTMRTTSNDYEEPEVEESSDEYESSSENEDPLATTKKKKPKKRRVRIRKHIQKASGHNHSHRRAFNEDKPWKSHIDIGFVTQAERKRYEGIWLTNRNCYLELLPWWHEPEAEAAKAVADDEGLMLNLVVLAIWSRSNLPRDKLAAIYDMVDTRNDGTLDRKSFLVGMWLVDQSLYGRKLPSRILPRVWESVDKYVINVPNEAQLGLNHENKQKQVKQELKQLKKELKRTQT
ncbi:LAFA_0E16578g1_1 [Lachancea sp. 'fantastica']|nr:LAFA_0E16578g1_1 [Lachancea sp. 'fantastica']